MNLRNFCLVLMATSLFGAKTYADDGLASQNKHYHPVIEEMLKILPPDAFGEEILPTLEVRMQCLEEMHIDPNLPLDMPRFTWHRDFSEGSAYAWGYLEVYKMNPEDDAWLCTLNSYLNIDGIEYPEVLAKGSYVYRPGEGIIYHCNGIPGVNEAFVVNEKELEKVSASILKGINDLSLEERDNLYHYERIYTGPPFQPTNVLKVSLSYYDYCTEDPDFVEEVENCLKTYFVWNGHQFEYMPDYVE